MKPTLRSHVAAAALLLVPAATLVGTPAAAQHRAVVATPTIQSLSLGSNAGLAPGATLQATVHATPGARNAHVILGDSGVRINLEERAPGYYFGTHVIRSGDRIDPTDRMRIRARYGEQTIAATVGYPPSFLAFADGDRGDRADRRAPEIERFVLNARGGIEPGRDVRFRLVGEPGARAWVRIPGVAERIELHERRPGVYVGDYTVRWRDDPDAFERAVATLQERNRRSTAPVVVRNDDGRPGYARDNRAPQITGLTPSNGESLDERGRVHLSARLSDQGSGVDPNSVRLFLNGREVTSDVRIRGDEIHYREDLDPGRHTAQVIVRDHAGNTARQAWSFDVVDRYGRWDRELPLEVTSHADNAAVGADGQLTIRGRTAPYASVHVQVQAANPFTGLFGLQQPASQQWVRADAQGRFAATLQPQALPIPGTRYDVTLRATHGTQTAEESLTLFQRQG